MGSSYVISCFNIRFENVSSKKGVKKILLQNILLNLSMCIYQKYFWNMLCIYMEYSKITTHILQKYTTRIRRIYYCKCPVTFIETFQFSVSCPFAGHVLFLVYSLINSDIFCQNNSGNQYLQRHSSSIVGVPHAH